jgi:eukaryotic-like serine/threonine-protein kinase
MQFRLSGDDAGERYRIKSYVNEGGMQEVYRAADTLLGRDVALKTPKNDDGERRFNRSAQASARVNHANVARTLDYYDHDGRNFLVEEFVDGLDLGALLKRIPQFDPYLVARVLHNLARGIAAVHAVGVVHRDLKPSNIMAAGGLNLTEVKVTDFGVAKMSEAEIDGGVAGGLLTLTGSKTLIGHLPYLAPEILRRRKTVSSSADIWAVGALAFHFLAGFPPFGDELAEVVPKILGAPVPLLSAEVLSHAQFRGLSEEIYGIAVACLQRDPASRPTAPQLVGLCERLCYPVENREVGTVNGYPGGSFGFADSQEGKGRVFFHVDSVLGPSPPRVGGEIWFSRHVGHPYDRAHPVVPILPETP